MQEVREGGGAGAGEPDDEDGGDDGLALDVGMGLDRGTHPEPGGQVAPQAHAHDLLAHGAEFAFRAQGVDQAVESLAERRPAEVRQSRLGHGGVDQRVGRQRHMKSDPPSTLTLAPVT